jgi:hypothetical protein
VVSRVRRGQPCAPWSAAVVLKGRVLMTAQAPWSRFVTLVVTVNGPETIWLLADRRLSSKGRTVKEDARKVMFLETTDGVAILGYCGLGATALGTEPADWMSAVLRGRNLPLEQSLGVLVAAIREQLPRHVPTGFAHTVIAPAFLGDKLKLYSIELQNREVSWRHWPVDKLPWLTARVAMGGSGGVYLAKHEKKKEWVRGVLRIIKAYDRGRVSALAVADKLAKLNSEVCRDISDKSVGPRCIVAWRNRKGGVHNGGGGHQYYTGTTRDASSPGLPTIGAGMDIEAIANLMMDVMVPQMTKMSEARRVGQPIPDLNYDELKAKLAFVPDKPDENLR